MLRFRHGPTTTGNGPRGHGSDTVHSPTRAGPQAAERTVEFFTATLGRRGELVANHEQGRFESP